MRLFIALRNIFRNKLRTLLNLIMISGGVLAICTFKGFSENMVHGLRESLIISDIGHFQIGKNEYWDNKSSNLNEILFSIPDKDLNLWRSQPGIKSLSGRLSFFGLISTGEKTLAARGLSYDVTNEPNVIQQMRIIDGTSLQNSNVVILGTGLASKLQVKPGMSITIVTTMIDNVINAFDFDVVGIFESGIADIDNASFIIPLKYSQKLLGTNKVEKYVALGESTEKSEELIPKFELLIKDQKNLGLRKWSQLSKFYDEVVSFYRVYNNVMQVIILSLILIGILNTISMSIFERTGEIGTIRALGESKTSLIFQFSLEGLFLGLLGGVIGLLLAFLLSIILNIIKIPIIIPGASVPLTILIDRTFEIYFGAFSLVVLTTIIATLWPAYRASKFEIVTALRKNI